MTCAQGLLRLLWGVPEVGVLRDCEDPNKDDLIDLRASKLLEIEFNATTLKNFWCSQQHSYQSLAKQAISTLIPFATTYSSEAAFSALVTTKTKQRNRLDVQHDMRVVYYQRPTHSSVFWCKKDNNRLLTKLHQSTCIRLKLLL